MTPDLLPCPFCDSGSPVFGVKVSEDHRGHDWETVVIECGGCITMEGRSAYRLMCPRPEPNWQEAARIDLAAKWNRRPLTTPCEMCEARFSDEHETWCDAAMQSPTGEPT